MNTPFRNAQPPVYIRLINRIGELLSTKGFVKPDLDAQRLILQAQKKTGLQDFGDDAFKRGLTILTATLREQAQLSQVGQIVAYFNLLDHLCVRLQLIDYRARRPDVARQEIMQPLFILGLPRTGTTILHELIAQDTSFRSPASWEVARPVPPARAETYNSDSRINNTDRLLAVMEKLSPGFRTIHAIGARLPQECVYMLASHFISEQFSYMYNIPEYRAWALEQDMTASYQWHAHFLQHLQVDFSGERWVLKTPAHLAYLQYVLKQYPDAAIVWTHRRPLDALASFSSLVSTLQGGFSRNIDPVSIGAQEFSHYSKVVASGMAQRAELGDGRFFDVGFNAICSDPIAVVADIYDYFGMRLERATERRMREYLKRRPRHLYGKHRYSHGEFGLDALQEGELYADYLIRFDDCLN